MEGLDVSIENTLETLRIERDHCFDLDENNKYKMLKLIDGLIERAQNFIGEPTDDIILIGDKLDLEVDYGDGDIESRVCWLGKDFQDDVVSFLGPIGAAILCQREGTHLTTLVREQTVNISIGQKCNDKKKLLVPNN